MEDEAFWNSIFNIKFLDCGNAKKGIVCGYRTQCLKQALIYVYEFRFKNIVYVTQICVYGNSSYLLQKYWYT